MSQKAKDAVAEAKRHLGYKPDPWSPTLQAVFDCSGLVQYCYKKLELIFQELLMIKLTVESLFLKRILKLEI